MKILVIEDSRRYSDAIVEGFRNLGASSISTALTIGQAELLLFHEDQVFDIIVIDACVPGDDYNTGGIIRRLRRDGFDGILVAASSRAEYRFAQMDDGCTLNGGPDKARIPLVVRRILPAR